MAIRNTHSYFAAREFEGAPSLDSFQPTYLILDGQQRLTSLFQAFYGVGEYQYFIRLKPLLDGAEDDCGVLTSKWLPYTTIVIPFAALLAKHPAKGLAKGEIRKKLSKWFW